MRALAVALAMLPGVALAMLPGVAHANFFELYGFNPRAVGMAGAQLAAADDFTAVYYNPAGLTVSDKVVHGFGLMLSRPNLTIAFDKPDPRLAALDPPNATAITFGGVFPFGTERSKAALAIALSIPTGSLLNGQALDPAIPHWYVYQSLPERIMAMIGLGVRPFEWLSLGMSAQLLAGLSGSLDYELDVVAGRFSRKTVLFDIEPKAAPIVGLEVRPIAGLRIGAVWRGPIETAIQLPVKLRVTDIADLVVDTSFTVQYNPHHIAVGASYHVEEIDLLISADLTYSLWSKAPDPSVDSRLDVGGLLFEDTGLEGALDAPAPGQERKVVLGFRDIFIPRFGLEKGFGPVDLRVGYALRPSPAPLQTGENNYVDGTAHHLSGGASLSVLDPFGLLANPLLLDASVLAVLHPGRRHEKPQASDPIGSYEGSGQIFVFGVALRYAFGEAPAEDGAPALEFQRPARKKPAEDAPEGELPEGEPPEAEREAQGRGP